MTVKTNGRGPKSACPQPIGRWTAGVVLTMALVAVPSVQAGQAGQAQPGQQPVREFEIAAGRYSFAPDTIEVNQGDRVRLIVRSLDVDHGFGIESLGIDHAIPEGGEPVVVEFVAERAGVFPFNCSVFCGAGHGRMLGSVRVAPRTGATDVVDGQAGAGAGAPRSVDRLEPDFTLVSLPTTLRFSGRQTAFRVTHRFNRPLGEGDVGNLVEDLFGLDSTALVGLEFRFSPAPRTQAGIYRTSDRTIQFFGQYGIVREGRAPVSVDALLAIDGTNNFRDDYSPAVGVVVSRSVADTLMVYAQPVWVGNANRPGLIHPTLAGVTSPDDDAFVLGLGGRVQVRPTVYVVAEVAPRLAGFDNGDAHASVAIEKRVGGHSFQLNFSNGIGSTYGQIAQGGSEDDWFIGFNISRKF